MRRTDREITDRQELLDVMARCDVCRLALNDESGYPYVVPLNFGMEEREGTLYLLFHGALTGTKYDRMEQDPRATRDGPGGGARVSAAVPDGALRPPGLCL